MKGSKRYAKATVCCMAVLASDWSCLVRTIGMHIMMVYPVLQGLCGRKLLPVRSCRILQNCLKDTVMTSSWIRANAIRFGHHPAA